MCQDSGRFRPSFVDFVAAAARLLRFGRGRFGRFALSWAGSAVFCCLFSSVSAAVDDVFVSYSTPGPDRYADGSPVHNGECYALVCTKRGSVFAGFTAAGTVSSPETDDIAVIAPAALDGHCRPVVFGLPRAYVDAHRTDTWSVQLLDTRNAAGLPVGLVNGVPGRINGSGPVDGTVTLDGGGRIAFGRADGPAQASLASALPPELVPQPIITDIAVRDGRVVLSVDDTVPFVTYDVSGAETPAGLGGDARRVAREPRDGVTGQTVTFEVESGGSARFFKVIRAK